MSKRPAQPDAEFADALAAFASGDLTLDPVSQTFSAGYLAEQSGFGVVAIVRAAAVVKARPRMVDNIPFWERDDSARIIEYLQKARDAAQQHRDAQ